MPQSEIVEINIDDLYAVWGGFVLGQWSGETPCAIEPRGDKRNTTDGVGGSVGVSENYSGKHGDVTFSFMQGTSSNEYMDQMDLISAKLPLTIKHLGAGKRYFASVAWIGSGGGEEFSNEVQAVEYTLVAPNILPPIQLGQTGVIG